MVLMNLEEKNSRKIEEFLKSKGAEVVGFASLEGIKNVPKEYPNSIPMSRERVAKDFEGLASKIPHKTTGTRSGLGWIGRCALLISPTYGAALRLSTILTDMPIKVGTPIDDSLCDDCTDCQDVCPVDAINEVKWDSRKEREEYFDAEKCFEFIKKEMQRTHGKSLCAKCGLACPYTKEYLGIETDRDLIKEI